MEPPSPAWPDGWAENFYLQHAERQWDHLETSRVLVKKRMMMPVKVKAGEQEP
jgi:hypothetical protein